MSKDRDLKKALRWDSGNRTVESKQDSISGPGYSISYACVTCKTAHKRHVEGTPQDYPIKMKCPVCHENMFHVGRHFKPPKKTNKAQWAKVEFLIKNGFLFQKIRPESINDESIPYPETLEEAKEFVVKYKKWAYKGEL